MDLSGLDIPRIKAIVQEKWRSGPELWPVKVMSLSRVMQLERELGRSLTQVGGYFTCLRAVRGKTPAEMEELLGFQPGSFCTGVVVYRLERLPLANEFELRGYSQLPGGETFDGIVLRRPGMVRPQYFSRDGEQLKYIPGLGVEQWELTPRTQIGAAEIQRVDAGQRFTNWR